MGNYILPDFKYLRPKNIKRFLNSLDSIMDKLDEKDIKDIFEISLKKLKNKEELNKREFKVLILKIKELKNLNLFDEFYIRLQNLFNTENDLYRYLVVLLQVYYEMYNDNDIFRILRFGIIHNKNIKEEFKYISKKIKLSNNRGVFQDLIAKDMSNCECLDDINFICDKYYIKKSSTFMKLMIALSIIKSNLKSITDSKLELIKYVCENIFQEEINKRIFENIILANGDIRVDKFDYNTNKIFRFIGEMLGNPHSKTKIKWNDIGDEAIKIFRNWQAYNNINIFFKDIAGDERRFEFWKQYARYFYRVEYFKNLDGAILMQGSDYLFVEFAKIGAVYMYRRDYLDIEKIEEKISNYSNTYVKTRILRDKNLVTERLVHTGSWEYNFEWKFEVYGLTKES